MFDIGWSEFALIAVVALIAIGPKELPGVLRMVGQWMGKARKMAAEFQGQFQEAMREAEMADLKKSFDEVKEAASGFTTGNLMTSLERDVSKALDIEGIDKPAIETNPAPKRRRVNGEAPQIRLKRAERRRTPDAPAFPTPGSADPRNLHRADAQRWLRSRWRSCRKFTRRPAPQRCAPG